MPAGRTVERGQVEAIWRIEAPRVIATLARMTGDLAVAEDLAQDAIVVALETWPSTGVPPNPGGWLTTTAKRRAIDGLRRGAVLDDKVAQLARGTPLAHDDTDALDRLDAPGDELLGLIFACCHPALEKDARVALTLKMLGGLTTPEIARAFLVPDTTLGQRISRAKRTLAAAGADFEVPAGDELNHRLPGVLEVIYLVFNEGHAATAGEHWTRPALTEEALRLGRVLAELIPDEPEVHGLLALMELTAARQAARVAPDGTPVLLADQDRTRWDRLLIARGLATLERAEGLPPPAGPYTLQAAIAACHARAPTVEETDWVRIAALYEILARTAGSPVVELNRAVAVGMAFGPRLALQAVDAIAADGRLDDYHLLASVRGDLLERLGRNAEARAEFDRAAALARNAREQELLLTRARGLERDT